MNKKQEMIFWAILYTILIFVITGILGVIFHSVVPEEGPDVYKFIYAGLMNFWDTILALLVGGYLVHPYHTNRKKK